VTPAWSCWPGDFDERDPAVKAMLRMAIKRLPAQGKYVGICGQGPSDHPDFACGWRSRASMAY
jgi:phosphoenolpyruvate synthase/pyruvate phosphate dikinase